MLYLNPFTQPPTLPRGHIERWWSHPYGPPAARVWTVRDVANRCAVCGHLPKRGSYRRNVGGLMCCETCMRLISAREQLREN